MSGRSEPELLPEQLLTELPQQSEPQGQLLPGLFRPEMQMTAPPSPEVSLGMNSPGPSMVRNESGASIFAFALNNSCAQTDVGDDVMVSSITSSIAPSPTHHHPRVGGRTKLLAIDIDDGFQETITVPPPTIVAPFAARRRAMGNPEDGGKYIQRILPSDQFPEDLEAAGEGQFGGLFLSPIAFAWNKPKEQFNYHNIQAVLSCVSAQGEELATILQEQADIAEGDHHCFHLDDSRDGDCSGGRSKCSFSLEPGGALDQALRFVHTRRSQGKGVLVHCDMGVQRSPSTICAYLIWSYSLDFDTASGFLRGVAPKSNFRIFQSSLRKVALEIKRQNMVCFLGGSQTGVDTPGGSAISGYLGSPAANLIGGSYSPLQLQMPVFSTLGVRSNTPLSVLMGETPQSPQGGISATGLASFSSLGGGMDENETPKASMRARAHQQTEDSLVSGVFHRSQVDKDGVYIGTSASSTTSYGGQGVPGRSIIREQFNVNLTSLNTALGKRLFSDPNALNLDDQAIELTEQQLNGPKKSCNPKVPALACSPRKAGAAFSDLRPSDDVSSVDVEREGDMLTLPLHVLRRPIFRN